MVVLGVEPKGSREAEEDTPVGAPDQPRHAIAILAATVGHAVSQIK